MPLDFVAQIDLEEAARRADLDGRLPDPGRLLFFWDALCGDWIRSTQSCRVLWDRWQPAALSQRAAPELPIKERNFERVHAIYQQT